MNGAFPPAPSAQSPFARYAGMAQPSEEQRRQQMMQQFAQQIVGQPTQNVAQGVGQMIAGAGLGLSKFNQQQSAAFPQAPGGAKPSIMTGLANFFTGRNNGGLY